MTDESFLKSRGLEPTKIKHDGPARATRLVEMGCHVFPLPLGSKIPARGSRGFLDGVPDASSITSNYGVWAGASNLVIVDLDDYVEGNRCDEFVAEYELPPTFTVITGSGGRQLWYAAPSVEVAPDQTVLGYDGVDLRAGGSYAVGPGSRLHASEIKAGSTGDGIYRFDPSGLKEFAPFPLSLITAIGKAKVAKLAARQPKTGDTGSAYATYDEAKRADIDRYVDSTLKRITDELDAMQKWPVGHRPNGLGWEATMRDQTASLATLVKAEWNTLGHDDIESLLRLHAPRGDGFTIEDSISRFDRAMENPDIEARQVPKFNDDEWFTSAPYVGSRPFGDASDELDPSITGWPEEAWNEEGHVERTKRLAAGALRWIPEEEIWVRYDLDLKHWVKDRNEGPRMVRLALKYARIAELENYDEAPKLDKDGAPIAGSSQRDKFRTMISDQSNIGMFERTAKALALSTDVNTPAAEFDGDGMLLAVKGGAVDLRTGKFIEGSKDLKITVPSEVVFDPAAEAPKFRHYLETSMPDQAMRHYLQTAIGYSLIKANPEGAFFIHWGPQTNNGKSVLMNLLRQLMGPQMRAASSKALLKSRNDKHTVEIADLYGPRVLQMGETPEGASLEEDTIKQVTGGDVIAARKLHQSNEDWKITGKIHILTNYLPHIAASPSMRRRLHLIVWPVEIVGSMINLDLTEELIASELSGILNWAIEGCLNWQKQLRETPGAGERKTGLVRPASAVMDMDRYFFEEDTLAEWLLERTHDHAETKSGHLYEDYKLWCWPQNIKPMSSTAFGRKLREKKIPRIERSDANYYAIGLKPTVKNDSWFKS